MRSQMQYRTSFVLGVVGQFLVTGIDFVAVWTLFDRFGALEAWTLAGVAVFYGTAHMAIALTDMLATGFDKAGDLIRNGTLDRLLLRPRTTALQLVGYDFSLRRVGRFGQGALVFTWPLAHVDVGWTLPSLLLLGATIFSGACLFLGLFALQATLAIWTVESVELANATTYGGVAAAQ
jgi:ABC-2 type transport system permease protein